MQVRKKGKQEIITSCFQYAEISRNLKEMHKKSNDLLKTSLNRLFYLQFFMVQLQRVLLRLIKLFA